MTNDLKARLDAMVREATPGEWFIQEENDPGQLGIMSVEPSDDPRYAKAVHQITNAYVVPEGDARLICFLRNSVPDILAALSKLDTAEAQVKELEEKLANWKANAEHIQGNFQRETLRTSEQYQMLVKWMKRNADKGCSAEPWAKDDCPDCTLMRETKELLERPINVTREESRKKGAEHGE